MYFVALSQVHYHRTFTPCGIACDGRYVTYRKIIQRIWTEFDTGSNSDFLFPAWNNISDGSMLTNIRG